MLLQPERGWDMSKQSKYVKFSERLKHVLRKARIPKHFSKYSNKIFTTWDHITLLAIRQYERKDYRGFIEWLRDYG